MDIRKIAVVAGFAVGAALALAPLASADPVEITSTVSSEIASLNSSFEFDALLAGDSADITKGSALNPFDVITPSDVGTVQGTGTTGFDYLVYGVDPAKAGLAGDPGAFNLFNGAEARFDDAYNVALYAAENNGTLDTTAADFFGSLPSGFANDTAAQAFESFYNSGIGDLSGFFQTDLSSLDITPAAATELFTLLGSL